MKPETKEERAVRLAFARFVRAAKSYAWRMYMGHFMAFVRDAFEAAYIDLDDAKRHLAAARRKGKRGAK